MGTPAKPGTYKYTPDAVALNAKTDPERTLTRLFVVIVAERWADLRCPLDEGL
jgi:hypothetical protein